MNQHWRLDDIHWETLAPDRIDPELLAAVKAAALVEANSADYVTYLHRVFAGDDQFKRAAEHWGTEERQHGDALGRWAEMVDPSFDYEAALARFRAGYQIPLDADASVRGSRSGELVARCVVESGTCSFYSAVRDASDEPVLRQIAGCIAQDEARHYQLFKTHLTRYLGSRKLGLWERLRIAFGRVAETDDDELSYAYYSANAIPEAYDRKRCARAYARCTMRLYQRRHVAAAMHMILNAVDINPRTRLARGAAWIGWQWLRFRRRQMAIAT